jgi:hypothetical protein
LTPDGHNEVKRSKSIALSPDRTGSQEVQTKRQRVGSMLREHVSTDDETVVSYETLFSEAAILQTLVSFLDPAPLLRCRLVSSSWKNNEVFSSDEVWMALATSRFGRFQVRQWMENESSASTSSMDRHRKMDEANFMPHFSQEDNMIRLGEGRIGSKVSAWAFAVKRSNGETTRSVKREPNDDRNSYADASLQCEYVPLPVVELRIVVQNTGTGNVPIIIKDQMVTVDASTRRRSDEFRSITWDDRLRMTVRKLDGRLSEDQFLNTSISDSVSPVPPPTNDKMSPPQELQVVGNELCRLGLYDAHVVTVFLHTQGCSTLTKFQERSNFTKLLVCLNGTTVPLVIPFPREDAGR